MKGDYYHSCVAKPLLSMGSTGSIPVKQVAKPLKNRVVTPEHNRLSTDKREILLHVGINMHLNMTVLKTYKEEVLENCWKMYKYHIFSV
jgi:hypothetical protein